MGKYLICPYDEGLEKGMLRVVSASDKDKIFEPGEIPEVS
jgi:hypothetical protein